LIYLLVCQAFVHDPLINWRLLKPNNEPKHADTSDAAIVVDKTSDVVPPNPSTAASAAAAAAAAAAAQPNGSVRTPTSQAAGDVDAERTNRGDREREIMQRLGTYRYFSFIFFNSQYSCV
jgi:phosphatidylinositol kinase/protein kinase (PI-3  family)